MKSSLYLSNSDNMPTIRIAPVCNGKIYVVPHTLDEGNTIMDLPMVEQVEKASPKSDKVARKIKENYHLHIQSDMQPRFSIQYKSATHQNETVYLYILPLRQEQEIQFQNGKFVSSEEIANSTNQYSTNLQQEGEFLGMAADLWNDYYSNTPIAYE